MSGLAPGETYRWRVVARSGCDPGKYAETPVSTFGVGEACVAPSKPSFLPVPGAVGVGQSYVVAVAPVALDGGGAYLVERATNASFSPVLDSQLTSSPSASFVARSVGTYWHRVSALAGCDPAKRSAPSAAASVKATEGQAVVVFAKPPQAMVVPTGPALDAALAAVDPNQSARLFTIQNISAKEVTVVASVNVVAGSPTFFAVDDPQGDSPALGIRLQPQETRTLHLTYGGVPSDTPGSYQGVLYLQVAGQPVVPYAYVNLKVGGQPAAPPVFVQGGTRVEFTSFEGFSARQDDAARPPLAVDVKNAGTTPMEVAAEIGPEVWLEPAAGWNATPIAPGASRALELRTRRGRAPAGSALPRYTYLTLRTRDGNTSRLLVQDPDRPPDAPDPRAALAPEVGSYVIPSVVNATSKIGNTFVSRVRLSNAASESVQAELVYTPAGADGFDASAVKRLRVVVPANDVVTLTDPLVRLFGLAPPAVGQLEVRADASRLGALTVTSAVDAPARSGGTFGFQLPVLRRGEGASLGKPQVIPAVRIDPASRTNVILAETRGRDGATVVVTLRDAAGATLGESTVRLLRYGQQQLALADLKGTAATVSGGSVEIAVVSGEGVVGGVSTVIDNANDDASSFVSRDPGDAAAARAAARAIRGPLAALSTVRSGIPSVVNGYPTFPGGPEGGPTFRTMLTLTSLSSAAATFTLTFVDLADGGKETVRTVQVAGRRSVVYENALEQLFGVAPGARSQGPIRVESTRNGLLTCRVFSVLPDGALGDSFPVIALPPDPQTTVTGPGRAWPLAVDGLEQSVDPSRGTRTNLILNEWTGKPARVSVALYEAGNRSRPIAERELDLAAYEKLQLSTVFRELGLDSDERRKDRTNVLCVVTPVSGEGLVSAVVTTIDNRTGDTRNAALLPAGGTTGPGVTIGF